MSYRCDGTKFALDYLIDHKDCKGINSDLKELLESRKWTKYEYYINLSLRIKLKEDTEEKQSEKAFGTFTFLHLVIMLQETMILNYVIENCKDLLLDEVSKPVKVTPTLSESVAICDSWIFGANCLHLATKFLPNGLTSLLANLEDKNLINKGCESGFTPLHCAVQRNDSLCTR